MEIQNRKYNKSGGTIMEKTRSPYEIAKDFQALIDQYDSVTCAATDCMDRLNGMYADLRPIGKDPRLAGVARTV